jgi:hypothetical protein
MRWVAKDYPLISYLKSFRAEELRTAITRSLATQRAALDEGRRCIERFTDREIAKRIDSIIRGRNGEKSKLYACGEPQIAEGD